MKMENSRISEKGCCGSLPIRWVKTKKSPLSGIQAADFNLSAMIKNRDVAGNIRCLASARDYPALMAGLEGLSAIFFTDSTKSSKGNGLGNTTSKPES